MRLPLESHASLMSFYNISTKKQGHPPGELLGVEQKQEIFDTIIQTTPDQIGLPYMLWTRSAVAELIWQRFGLRRSPQTIGSYLKQWGFTSQKPASLIHMA